MSDVELGTAAWYGDQRLRLGLPERWSVTVHRPRLGPPLTADQIREAFSGADGQRLAGLSRGSRRPVVLVDDLTRPTPAADVLPPLLDILGAGGRQVTVLVAAGSHAPPSPDALARKLGPLPPGCRVAVHDFRAPAVRLGTTSFGTRVRVNPLVAEADCLIGVGGIYPQSTTGFGGGSKIVLGVMAERSIVQLHYGHRGVHGSYDIDNDFRRDLDEAAALAGLTSSVSLFVDDARRPVRMLIGPPGEYYADAVRWAREAFRAPPPGSADVVVSNAYPMDVSLTFMRSKGLNPFRNARPGASRIVVAGCPEGVGHHGVYPFLDVSRFYRERHVLRLLWNRRRSLPRIAGDRVRQLVRSRPERVGEPTVQPPGPVGLFVPPPWGDRLPDRIPGMRLHRAWESVLDQVRQEQDERDLQVAVYSCAPLHVVEPDLDAGSLEPGAFDGSAGGVR